MKYDFNKLRGRIKEKLKNETRFAEKLDISSASLSYKLNNLSFFTAEEISRAIEKDVLDLSIELIGEYFFTEQVENNSTNK